MLKKKCPACAKKIERKFVFCPWCGHSFRKQEEEDSFGMLGRDDELVKQAEQMKLPFGMNTIVNGLMKQLEKELGNLNNVSPNGKPKGFKIQISTGMPKMQVMENGNIVPAQNNNSDPSFSISDEEKQRRSKLARVNAKSNIRRLPEGVVYEIETPGVNSKSDVVITKLEESLELKAYSNDKCYIKTIPMKVEILGYTVKENKVFLKVKG